MIKVGDLVVVTGGCCSVAEKELGWVREVTEIVDGWDCAWCKRSGVERTVALGIAESGRRWGRPVRYVKRIPPLPELERDQIVKELTA